MWVIADIGFFSVVQKPQDEARGTLTVRARAKQDLESLRERYLPALGPVQSHGGTDYGYRAVVPREDLSRALARMVESIDYDNFKSAVASRHGSARAKIYGEVWSALWAIQHEQAASKTTASRPTMAYGAVLIRGNEVLLREPAGHFDGYVWTFAKGRPRSGETPEACARRELLEETGYTGEIVKALPGEFEGGTTVNRYFLMTVTGEPRDFDRSETTSVRWVGWHQAARLIAETLNEVGRSRDLAVLAAARRAVEQRRLGGDGAGDS